MKSGENIYVEVEHGDSLVKDPTRSETVLYYILNLSKSIFSQQLNFGGFIGAKIHTKCFQTMFRCFPFFSVIIHKLYKLVEQIYKVLAVTLTRNVH